MSKTALVLGCGGQDGSLLCEHLLNLGWAVHGMHRRSSCDNLWRIKHLKELKLHRGDVTDCSCLVKLLDEVEPDLILNEADQDHVGCSHEAPLYSVQVTYGGCANLLEAVRQCEKRVNRGIRVFQPCSATMLQPQQDWNNASRWMECDESDYLDPQSPYACAKAACYYICRFYRQAHGLHVVCGILFNHDSPKRGDGYLLGSIVKQARAVAAGKLDGVTVGSLDLRVDIGHAKEFMEGAVKLMELPEADDWCLGTGKPYAVGRLVTEALSIAFDQAGKKGALRPELRREDATFRPDKPVELIADCGKARVAIGWEPQWDALRMVRLLMGKGTE